MTIKSSDRKGKAALFIFAMILMMGVISATIIITPTSPADNYIQGNSSIELISFVNITGGNTIKNISLFHNASGTWTINDTILFTPTASIQENGITIDLGDNTAAKTGMKILAKSDVVITSVLKAASDASTNAYIANSTLDIIATASFGGDRDAIFSPSVPIITGNNYYILADSGGSARDTYYKDSVTYPISNTYLNWTAGYRGGSGDRATVAETILSVNISTGLITKTQNFSFGSTQSFLWGVEACDSSETCGVSDNRTLIVRPITTTYNATSYETTSESFYLNVSDLTSANIVFNGTEYTATVSEGIASRTITPSTTGNLSFYWKINGGMQNSSIYYQNRLPLLFGLCNASLNVTYMNFTFLDESTSGAISASIPTATFSYFLGNGTIYKTYSFINNTVNYNYTFCLEPAMKSVNVNISLQYKNGTAYPQRTFEKASLVYSNLTTLYSLLLLSSSDGVYETIQVLNSADQPISGVTLLVTRMVGTVLTTIGSGLTADDGTYTFWLNPDFTHTINASKTGYTTGTYTFVPTGSGKTIVLGGSSSSSSDDYTRGMSIIIKPNTNFLYNETTYPFNFTLSSSFWDVTEYGFVLRNSSGILLGLINASTNGGIVNYNLDTGNQSVIYMDYYWVVSGNTTTGTTFWSIEDSSGTGWSIKNFFDDFTTYMDSDMFGLTDFGRAMIAFIIIFVVVGIMGYKYGLDKPIAMAAILFTLVFLFDVGLGWLTLDSKIWVVDHFPTIATALILIGITVKEVQQ